MLVWLAWLLIGSSLFMVAFYMNVYNNVPINEVEARELETEPKVSILMPAYNEEGVVEGALESALDIEYENLEIIFVDDGSSDSTYQKAEQYREDPRLKLIQHPENRGKGEALNTALENADSEYMIVQDADSKIDSQLIIESVAKMESNTDTGAVITSIRPLETETFFQKLQIIEYTLTNFYRNLMSHIDVLDITPGAFSMYRTEQVKNLGGFDEDNLTEDLELAWRIRKDGKSIEMAFQESAQTEFPKTFKQLYSQRVRWARGFIRNAYEKRDMIFNKEYGWFGRFQLPIQLVLPVLSIIGFWLVAIGWFQGLFNLGIQLSTTGLQNPLPQFGKLTRSLLGISVVVYIPLVASLGFSAYELKIAYSESDMKIGNVLSLAFYFFLFFMLKGFFWMAAILKELVGSKKTWT
ncbi:MAG: glycosyltransferase family 2 protein [Candidatus Nanohalobium sp.]